MTENRAFLYNAFFAGLVLFAFTLPLSKSINSIIMGLLYLGTILSICCMADFRRAIRHAVNQPLLLPIGIYLSTAAISLIFSQNILEGIGIIKQISNLMLIYFLVSVLINIDPDSNSRFKKVEYVLVFFMTGIFVLDILGLLTYFGLIAQKKYILPLTPLNMHHIWFGNLNAIGLYTAFSLLLFSPHARRLPTAILIYAFILTGFFSVLLSLSRTAWVGMLLTSVISSYFLFKNKRVFIAAGISMIVCFLLLYLFNDIVHSRIDRALNDISLFSTGVSTTSLGARFLMWKAAFGMFLSNPVFGVGIGDYQIALNKLAASGRLPDFILKYNQPHNMYLFALATQGIIGLSALLFIFYRIMRIALNLIKLVSEERVFGCIALAVAVHFLAAGFTESLMNIHVLISAFAFIMGAGLRASCLKEGRGGRI